MVASDGESRWPAARLPVQSFAASTAAAIGSSRAISSSSSSALSTSYAGAARSSVRALDPFPGRPAGVGEPAVGVHQAPPAQPVDNSGQLRLG
jgi:hypothetical protein